MSDVIGRGVIQVEADASSLQAGLAKAEQAVEKFERAAVESGKAAAGAMNAAGEQTQTAAGKVDAATKRFIASLERQAMQAGKTRSEYLELRAAQMGLSDQAAPFIRQIRASEQQMGSLALSAKQTTAAMRLLPAQITDIVTGLASGQPAYLVAIQQGGQLKDSFGGIVPAAKALLSVFTPMRIAIGGAVGVVGALAYGYYEGSKEADEFSKTLAMQNNVIGLTTGQLMTMAASVDAVVGTQAQAAAALNALVASQAVNPADLEKFATTAVRMERDVGIAVKDTVEAFKALGEEPTKASEKLNSTYRYLTLAVYDQIRALEEQGRVTDAGRLAQEEFRRAQERVANASVSQLGYIERGWRGIKGAIAEAIDALSNWGRNQPSSTDIQKRIDELRKQDEMGLGGPFGTLFNPTRIKNLEAALGVAKRQEEQAKAQGENTKREQDAIAARQAVAKWTEAAATKQEKYNKLLKEYRENNQKIAAAGGVLDPRQVKREEAAIRLSVFGEGKKPRAVTDDAATRMLQQARETEAALTAQLETEEKLGAEARRRVEFEQLIADLKQKKVLTADQKSLLANEQAIKTQLDRNEAIEKELSLRELIDKKQKDQIRAEEQFIERAAQIQEQIASSRAGRNEQYDRQLGAFGQGDMAREQIASQAGIFREFQRLQAQLLRGTPEHLLGSDKYISESMKIKAALDQALADHDRYYAALREKGANWQFGMSRALMTYLEESQNVAQQSERLWSGAFRGLEDALTEFVTTGKMNFKDLGNFIVAEVNRMIIRTQIVGPLAQSMNGSGGGIFGQILGNIFPSMMSGGGAPISASVPSIVNALGNIYGPSGLHRFAAGGLVSSPTMFGFKGGAGLMGEAGPEAIMPVARTASGELGVKVTGQQKPQAVTVVMNISTPDAASFRRSEGQIKSRMASVVGTGRRFA